MQQDEHAGKVVWFSSLVRGGFVATVRADFREEEEKRNMQLDMQLLQTALGRGRVTFSLSLHIYSPIK